MTFRQRLLVLPSLLAIVGCGPVEQPRGKGATGTAVKPKESPNTGMALINKLEPEQSKAFEWMHRPAASVIKPNPGREKSEWFEKIQELWKSHVFARVTEGERYAYTARFVTSAGIVTVNFSDPYTPNHVRNFILLSAGGYFDGKPLALSDDVITCGPSLKNADYTLLAERYSPWDTVSEEERQSMAAQREKEPGFGEVIPQAGALMTLDEGDRSSGQQFALCARPAKSVAGRATFFGAVASPDGIAVLEKIEKELAAKKPVLVEKVEINRRTLPLFTESNVQLPRLTESGRPDPYLDSLPPDAAKARAAQAARQKKSAAKANPTKGKADTRKADTGKADEGKGDKGKVEKASPVGPPTPPKKDSKNP